MNTDAIELLERHKTDCDKDDRHFLTRGRDAGGPLRLFGDHPSCFFALASCLFSSPILLFLEAIIFLY